jgi:hypothetical protein
MGTTQPWQVFAWATTRYGELRIRIASVNLTREGISVLVHIIARSWKQRWNREEAVDLAAGHLRRGEWTPLLTAWLGDGKIQRRKVLRGDYSIVIATKEPWRLGLVKSRYEALVARGKEAFVKLRESAGAYSELLDLLRAHKWIDVVLATDKGLRAAYKLKMRKRGIDILRDERNKHKIGTNSGGTPGPLHRPICDSSESPTEQFSATNKPKNNIVVVAGVMMNLYLVNSRGGSLFARLYTRDVEKALAVAERLESAGLRPNVARSGPNYMVYITTVDLLRLAERDETIRKTIALYLVEKAKNGTPRQREIAEKILKRHPFFLSS